ncbi:MAG: Gfo/Idh/MocA family oxidoreductase [Mariniphaga sp.]|nr:Gfo/Idh/MocA family oxidoreductase [Mariniphaga sp.]
MQKIKIGFLGAGGIARAHAYSLQAVKFYYDNTPEIEFTSVASARKESREQFAKKYGFREAESVEEFSVNKDINTVFILGPNNTHFEHLELALQMPSVKNIYLEKPVCASEEEEIKMKELLSSLRSDINIMVGFQYLQTASMREALQFWKSKKLGNPIHFDLKYYHGDYLQSSYREKRVTRLTPAPDGGAMADLGSHGLSLLVAFFNENLQILNALQAGSFDDVPEGSDLFSSLSLFDKQTGAAGNMSASRISSGSGDLIHLEIYAEKGTLRYSSHNVDFFEYYFEETGQWIKQPVGSHYKPVSSFPSGHVPPGWLRAMVHAHYMFLTGDMRNSFMPDLNHGLAVQRLVRETADYLKIFRAKITE